MMGENCVELITHHLFGWEFESLNVLQIRSKHFGKQVSAKTAVFLVFKSVGQSVKADDTKT